MEWNRRLWEILDRPDVFPVDEWSMFVVCLDTQSGRFRDESFQAISCTGSDTESAAAERKCAGTRQRQNITSEMSCCWMALSVSWQAHLLSKWRWDKLLHVALVVCVINNVIRIITYCRIAVVVREICSILILVPGKWKLSPISPVTDTFCRGLIFLCAHYFE